MNPTCRVNVFVSVKAALPPCIHPSAGQVRE